MIKRFCIYASFGIVIEIFWTGLAALIGGDYSMSGHSSVLMLPVYGGVVLLEPLFEMYRKNKNILKYMLYGTVIIAAEYYFGYLYRLIGVCPWDYSGVYCNVDGLIRIDYYPAWIAAGAIYERMYKLLT